MKLPGPPLPQIHLQPGELVVTREPQWVITLLGSCVAITMFNATHQLAAICHCMLPRPGGREAAGGTPENCFRYLTHAVPAMLEPFARLRLPPGAVEVKMFGGANVIHLGGDPQNDRWIGSTNVALARHLLQVAQLPIRAQNVGGNRGCKIVFNTRTGEVLHKHLSAASADGRHA